MAHSSSMVKRTVQKYHTPSKMHRIHYLKWALDDDWSIRYFWTLDARPEYVQKYVLKSHDDKEYIILTQREALDYIKNKAISLQPEEIFGTRVNGKYHKTILQHS